MADPDWTDPCAVAEWLAPKLPQVAAGGQVVETQHGDTRVRFSQSNYDALAALYRQKVAECAAVNGGKPRRRAFLAG